MKKLLFIPLAALAISCGGESSADTAMDDLFENYESSDGINDIYDYNDALLAEVTFIQDEFEKVNNLDDLDGPADEFILEVNKSMEIIETAENNLAEIEPYGSGGKAFLDAVKNYVTVSEKYMTLYLDYSEVMAIPDEEWTSEQIDDFIAAFEPVDEEYLAAYDKISSTQETYASMNGTSVED